MSTYLPNAANARIDPRKLRDYALNTKHATGRFKGSSKNKFPGLAVKTLEKAG